MRPSGKLHVGNYLGALQNWVQLQDEYECFYMVADWHALTTEYENTENIKEDTLQMVMDWVAAGLDPEKSAIFVQSSMPQHAELYLLLSMNVPLSWLERNPTYKEQLKEVKTRDLHTYGFLGYPVLQAADILLYKARAVPVGEDQLAHLELTREMVRRFHHIYKTNIFQEPQPLLTHAQKVLGVDNRKMSKSYDNAILLSASQDETKARVRQMITDPQKIKKGDPGHPEICNVFTFHKTFSSENAPQIEKDCRSGALGCVDCKNKLADNLSMALLPLREKRKELEAEPKRVQDVLEEGRKKANHAADKTMEEVRSAMKIG